MCHSRCGRSRDALRPLRVNALSFRLRAVLFDEGERITFRAKGGELLKSQPAHFIFEFADLEVGSFAYYVLIDKIYISIY